MASRMRCGSPPGQRARRAAECQVVQADVEQESQPGLHLFEHLVRDGLPALAQGQLFRNAGQSAMGQLADVGNGLGLLPADSVTARISGFRRVPSHPGTARPHETS